MLVHNSSRFITGVVVGEGGRISGGIYCLNNSNGMHAHVSAMSLGIENFHYTCMYCQLLTMFVESYTLDNRIFRKVISLILIYSNYIW